LASSTAPRGKTKKTNGPLPLTKTQLIEYRVDKSVNSVPKELGTMVHWPPLLTRSLNASDVGYKKHDLKDQTGWNPVYNAMARQATSDEVRMLLDVMLHLENNPEDTSLEHLEVYLHSRLHVASRREDLRARIDRGEIIYLLFDANHRTAGLLLLTEEEDNTITLKHAIAVSEYRAETPLVLTSTMSMLTNSTPRT
jgi:hypothetical protein